VTRCREARATAAWSLALLTSAANPACADDKPVYEYLDEQTAATVTTALEPLVFARERPDLAVNARDYVSLVPIEVNRSGVRRYYWFGYLWSTIDRRNGEVPLAKEDQLVLLADDRPIALQPAADSMQDLGIARAPLKRPGRAAVAVLLQADAESVIFAAHATGLSLVLIHDGRNQDYASWRDAREAVGGFANYLGLEGP
jgi:hypothetical protein